MDGKGDGNVSQETRAPRKKMGVHILTRRLLAVPRREPLVRYVYGGQRNHERAEQRVWAQDPEHGAVGGPPWCRPDEPIARYTAGDGGAGYHAPLGEKPVPKSGIFGHA